MNRTFDTLADTPPAADYSYGSAQQMHKAAELNAERIFKFRFVHGIQDLPKYIISAIDAAGYDVAMIGSTTYQHSTFALFHK